MLKCFFFFCLISAHSSHSRLSIYHSVVSFQCRVLTLNPIWDYHHVFIQQKTLFTFCTLCPSMCELKSQTHGWLLSSTSPYYCSIDDFPKLSRYPQVWKHFLCLSLLLACSFHVNKVGELQEEYVLSQFLIHATPMKLNTNRARSKERHFTDDTNPNHLSLQCFCEHPGLKTDGYLKQHSVNKHALWTQRQKVHYW